MTEEERRRLAELETAQARAGKNAAELQRDAVAGIAVNESVHRAVAENVAIDAKMRADQAESRERSAATSAGIARQDATYERAAASNATFSATMIGIVAVGIVLAAIGYFAWWQPNHPVDASTNTFSRTEKTTEKTTETAAQAPNVIVKPADVNVKVNVPAATPKEDEQKPAADDSSGANAGTKSDAPPDGGETKPSESKNGTDGR